MIRPTLFLLVFMCAATWVQAADAPTFKGKVDAVTVYRGQALVTRLVEVPPPGGLREIIITDLPDRVVPGSIYAESSNGTEVRSILYRERPVAQDVRAEVRKIDEQIKAINEQIQAVQRNIQVVSEQKTYLSKLETFVAPTATVEMTKGVLNAETVKAISLFLFEQHKAVAAEELKNGKDQRDLQEQLTLLQRQRDEVSRGSARTVREAVVFASVAGQGGNIRLRYLVEQATWDPSYNIRADAAKKQINVEYNASIQQMSGEDWTDVTMTLSTASPSLLAKAPVLEPLTVALAATPGGAPVVSSLGATYLEARRNYKQQKAVEEQNRARNFNLDSSTSAQFQAGQQQKVLDLNVRFSARDEDNVLNKLADELQVMELVSKDVKGKDDDAMARASEGISVDYQLAGRLSLPSRTDRQLLQIASLPMKGQFNKVAVPVLTNYVYEEASIANESKMVLLAGPVLSYVAGQFVGHNQIPTVAIGENFTVGFGIDSSLRVSRELLDKSENVQGGNRVLNFSYRLSIENFSGTPAAVRLMDRLPTGKDTEVRVTPGTMTQELSKDPTYVQQQRKKGILRWDIEVPAQATGPKAMTLDFQYKVEYDRQMSIAGLPLKK